MRRKRTKYANLLEVARNSYIPEGKSNLPQYLWNALDPALDAIQVISNVMNKVDKLRSKLPTSDDRAKELLNKLDEAKDKIQDFRIAYYYFDTLRQDIEALGGGKSVRRMRLTPKTKQLMGIKEEQKKPFHVDAKQKIDSAFIKIFDKDMWNFLSKSELASSEGVMGNALVTFLGFVPTLCYQLKKEGFDPFEQLPYTFDFIVWLDYT